MGGNRWRVGITDYAQGELGDIVFVELPEIGAEVAAGAGCASVESVKSVSDIYAPFDGEITKVNGDLESAPETVNSDPEATGWLFEMNRNGGELDGFMNLDAYLENIGDKV